MKMFFKICVPISFLYCIGIIIVTTSAENTNSVRFSWKCKNNNCIKETVANNNKKEITAFNACMLLCNASTLWPQPIKYSLDGPVVHIKLFSVIHSSNDRTIPGILQTMIKGAEDVFRGRLNSETSQTKKELSDNPTHKLNVQLAINDLFQHDLTLSTDESYTLTIKKEKNDQMLAVITGETFFGVRHGLETLAQLIVYDNVRNGLIMPKSAHITDKPQFPYRGLLLDTARNYFSVESIKRTIDVMAANKLNSFHWHITDSQSFPLMLYDFPQFAEYGAYSSKKIYTERDVKSIREYALIRGIRLVPELDAPAHTGEGWQWTPADTILCLNKEPWSQYCFQPPCGQLNPLSEHVYKILGELYKNFIRLFKPDIFHMGGDEVHFGCWDTSEEINKWIAKNHPNNENAHGHNEMKKFDDKAKEKGFFALWSMFQENALVKLKEATAYLSHKPDVVLWSSNLATGDYLNKDINSTDYIIQVWVPQASSNISELLKKGFRIILSNYDALYFDSGFGSYVSNFSTSIYRPWHSVYGNVLQTIDELPEEQRNLILGQEAALWTEMASEGSLDSKFWPRAAALAERTWTNPQTYWREAESRMLYHRDRLVRLGVDADAIEPEWCGLNRGGCS